MSWAQDILEKMMGRKMPLRKKGIKLSPAQVNQIKKLHKSGSGVTDLAKKFKVNKSTVSRILDNKLW